MNPLFNSELKIINIGLKSFIKPLQQRNVAALQVDWRPPISIDQVFKNIITENDKKINGANKIACKKILRSKPVLVDLDIALRVIPGMKKNVILHAGPPVTWNKMCGPMKGAIMGALKYEGLVKDDSEAEILASSGKIEYAPCHEFSSVGPMAGIVSASMPVFVVKNEEFGNLAFCTMNEGLGKVLRYGSYGEKVIKKLKWMEKVLYPILKSAVNHKGRIDLKNLIAQALHMGDEVHNRNRAATSLFYRQIAPAIISTSKNNRDTIKVLDFLNGNDHFFLNLSMAACKVTLDSARNVAGSSIVVAMARNGTEFGIQLSGTGDLWFTGDAPVPDALYFPGYTKKDANPDIGDSSITETNGLGGFAIAASPAIVQFVGGSTEDAINYTLQMYEITGSENNVYQIPYLNFRGTPTGIDVRKVIEKNLLPFIDTGVAHKSPGVGQVGAGILNAPAEPFRNAYIGLAKALSNGSYKSDR
jgi:hypothetical protein